MVATANKLNIRNQYGQIVLSKSGDFAVPVTEFVKVREMPMLKVAAFGKSYYLNSNDYANESLAFKQIEIR